MKVITVFKTHVDIGFTDLPLAVLSRYAGNMLANAIETCERTKTNPEGERFVWTLPAYPLYYALERTTPEMRKRAEALIKDGSLCWHALPFTLRTEFFSKQELTDSFLYSNRLAERYGVAAPRSAKMTDVPGHTQVLVDVLVENGVHFLHLGSNPAVTRPDVPVLFWWESAAGNRILTYYNKDYGGALWFDRTGLDVKSLIDDGNDANVWHGYSRFIAGFNDFRAFACGGVTDGTQLISE